MIYEIRIGSRIPKHPSLVQYTGSYTRITTFRKSIDELVAHDWGRHWIDGSSNYYIDGEYVVIEELETDPLWLIELDEKELVQFFVDNQHHYKDITIYASHIKEFPLTIMLFDLD